ncbi:MAG TPA: NADH-quinone oxidoreductase subunit J [Gemmatimonadaceae bacterium]|jgi:NADH-quinone oxidoreductase subunit J|nr:NADH-quinone oxidoreductase subunit J [Gemmatimonadaceae bacterium]
MPYGFVYEFLFYLFGLIAVASAAIFVTRRNPVAAALWLVNTMFCIAALYIMMDAQFVGAIQVLVYAGAIMVVFLFVVMLLNLGLPPSVADIRGKGARIVALLAGLALLAEVLVIARQKLPAELAWLPSGTNVTSTITEPLFRAYLLPFEITSVLLLVAIVGAVVLAKKRS